MAIYILIKKDNEEMVYTGISRVKQNAIIFVEEDSKCTDF